jgi:hypothetical protein
VTTTLNTVDLLTVRSALEDAAHYRRDAGPGNCSDCRSDAMCEDHRADEAIAADYIDLAARLNTAAAAAAKARDDRRAALWGMSRQALAVLYNTGVTKPGGGTVRCLNDLGELARWSKDDLIAAILNIEHPQEVTP